MSARHPASLFDLAGKPALVTGCRRGIGRAAATGLAAAGADIVGVSAALDKAGGEVGEEVRACGRAFAGFRWTSPSAIRSTGCWPSSAAWPGQWTS